tara:strand:+ start:135 stop:329 length:195 start_codon:yes stop_codon:yes gene_type:complete
MEMENGNLPWKQVTLQLTRILDAGRKGAFPPMEWHGISVSRLPAAGAVYYFKSVFKVGNGEWRM